MRGVSTRPLLMMLLALMVALGSTVLATGGAMAMSLGDLPAQAASTDHCGGADEKSAPSPSSGDDCCIAMAPGLPATTEEHAEDVVAFERLAVRPVTSSLGPVFTAKLPTPPPRLG